MTAPRNARSFSEVTFAEAAGRHVPVDLVPKPAMPSVDTRLRSYFLGIARPGEIVLAAPECQPGRKVFLPTGWDLELAFELEGTWAQAPTTVLGHCMFPRYPTKRVDGVVVRQPAQLTHSRSTRRTRHDIDPDKPYLATIWRWDLIREGVYHPLQYGRLVDWSEDGLGLRIHEDLALGEQSMLVIRLERISTRECIMLWGRLVHCTPQPDGAWRAGVTDIRNMGPGEAVGLMEHLAMPSY